MTYLLTLTDTQTQPFIVKDSNFRSTPGYQLSMVSYKKTRLSRRGQRKKVEDNKAEEENMVENKKIKIDMEEFARSLKKIQPRY